MSVKIYDREQKKWIIFPGTMGAPGKDAYLLAQENGYTGTKEEYSQALILLPKIIESINKPDEIPTQDSQNLVKSGGTWRAINIVSEKVDAVNNDVINKINIVNNDVNNKINTVNNDLTNKITNVETTLTTKINNVETSTNAEIITIKDDIIDNVTTINNSIAAIRISEIPNQIKVSIVNDLESTLDNKSLSANQGRVLKEMIGNLVNISIQVVDSLPVIGEPNIIYFVKKEVVFQDVYDEFIFIMGQWEKIGNTKVDLSNYYTKQEVDSRIQVIPEVEILVSGTGNVITSMNIDVINKHKVNAVKNIDVYSKKEVDDKISASGGGDVMASATFTTVDRVITASGPGKSIKDSGVLISNLALKSSLGALASKDKISKTDLTFTIPDPLSIDAVLSTTSENTVQNKVITSSLNTKVSSSVLLDYYNKTEVDNKISLAGGGDVLSNGSLVSDNIILGNGNKTIKSSSTPLSNLALKTDFGAMSYKDKVDLADLNFSIPPKINIDAALSETSENPVQNKIITVQLNNKANTAAFANYYNKVEVDNKISSAGGGDVLADNIFINDNIILGSRGKTIKDSTISINSIVLKTALGALSYKDKVGLGDLSFSLPASVIIDTALSTTSANPVENRVITSALSNKVNSSSLSNYYLKTETYSQAEIDNKIGSAGGGDIMANGVIIADKIILGSGSKSIKDSGVFLKDVSLKSELGLLASKDKVNESDVTFNIPNEVIVDSVLNATSLNPVQNKIITLALNDKVNTTSLNNYYVKSETYTQVEINDKIAASGGGDVMSSGAFAADKIIVGSGLKSIKDSGILLSSLATQSWVSNLGFVTANTWRPIKVGDATLNDSSSALTLTNGLGISLKLVNGVVTISNSHLIEEYILPAASNIALGGIKIGYTETLGDSGIAVRLDATNKAYVNVSSSSISAALGYVPANTNSIKEIPTVLPNPFPLCITAGGSETVYTGATQSNINVDGFYTKKMIYEISREHVGNGGYIHALTQSWALTGNETYSEDNPDSIIIVPFNCAVTTTRNPKVKTSEGFNSITSTSGYKCYCFTRITDNLILANVQIYI